MQQSEESVYLPQCSQFTYVCFLFWELWDEEELWGPAVAPP